MDLNMGNFKKCLEFSEMARNAIRLKKFQIFVSIEYSWIVLFLVLFILGIGKINNTIVLRTLLITKGICAIELVQECIVKFSL